MVIGEQIEVSATTLNIFKIKICVHELFRLLIPCPKLILMHIKIMKAIHCCDRAGHKFLRGFMDQEEVALLMLKLF